MEGDHRPIGGMQTGQLALRDYKVICGEGQVQGAVP